MHHQFMEYRAGRDLVLENFESPFHFGNNCKAFKEPSSLLSFNLSVKFS